MKSKIAEKFRIKALIARGFSKTPETLQRVVKGIIKRENSKLNRVQVFNTVRWETDSIGDLSNDKQQVPTSHQC